MTNDDRADAEGSAEFDTPTRFRDLLADLMRLADHEGVCFTAAHAMATTHDEAEVSPNDERN